MSKESYAKKRGMEIFNKINSEIFEPFTILGDGKYQYMEDIIHRVVEETISIERTGKPLNKLIMSKDRKENMWNAWNKHNDEMRGPNWAGVAFSFWLRSMLSNTEFFDRLCDGGFTRKDALDVLLAHHGGSINCDTPYPWEWKESNESELR